MTAIILIIVFTVLISKYYEIKSDITGIFLSGIASAITLMIVSTAM